MNPTNGTFCTYRRYPRNFVPILAMQREYRLVLGRHSGLREAINATLYLLRTGCP
jgi:hypothetical protein